MPLAEQGRGRRRGPRQRGHARGARGSGRPTVVRSDGRGRLSPRRARGYHPGVTYRAVFFDAGETLVHPAPSFPELFASIVTREGHPRAPEDVIAASAVVMDRFSEAARDRELWTTSPGALPGVLARGVRADAGRARAALGRRAPRHPLPGVHRPSATTRCSTTSVAVLGDLAAAGMRLGIVSNFEAWLEDLLGALGRARRVPRARDQRRRGHGEARPADLSSWRSSGRGSPPADVASTSATTPSSTSTRRPRSACSRC